ncbi:hypothetical protein MKW98_017863 [Papaver atlanticum]|uniref:Uncharacterized protein n=1 Tax=Papaver atlanticum TaxID=357466 RepID=A0AAD4XVU6_9MAGN|nr:hypothetical protein MKW98_017863 [Papaver atlanticum]
MIDASPGSVLTVDNEHPRKCEQEFTLLLIMVLMHADRSDCRYSHPPAGIDRTVKDISERHSLCFLVRRLDSELCYSDSILFMEVFSEDILEAKIR